MDTSLNQNQWNPNQETTHLAKQFRDSLGQFLTTLMAVSEADFNRIPFAGSWTPAQVADHVLKFLSGTAQVLEIPGIPTSRPFTLHVPTLKNIFLNFEASYKAPQFVEPDIGPFEKQALVNELKDLGARMDLLMADLDLELLCKGADFPTLGEMTGWEWLHFALYHTQRHQRQLERMLPAKPVS